MSLTSPSLPATLGALLFSLSPLLQAEDPEFNPRIAIEHSFPPIVEPESVSAQQGETDKWVRDDELVLGVVIDGAARAYPINTLNGPRREIINDELGGRSIAATW